MTLLKVQQAIRRFMEEYGIMPNAVLVSLEHLQYLPKSSHILNVRIIECEHFSEPQAILMTTKT